MRAKWGASLALIRALRATLTTPGAGVSVMWAVRVRPNGDGPDGRRQCTAAVAGHWPASWSDLIPPAGQCHGLAEQLPENRRFRGWGAMRGHGVP